jgi:hypothetical protein
MREEMYKDLSQQLENDAMFITAAQETMPDFIDASFLKTYAHSSWDIALTCDKCGEMKKKRVKDSKNFLN